VWQAISLLGQYSRIYWWSHDEALSDNQCNADAMWADPMCSTPIRERQRSVVQLEWQIEASDATNPAEEAAAEVITTIMEDMEYPQQFKRSLLDAFWWGRGANQFIPEWNYDTGERRLKIRAWEPIHGDNIVFKFDGRVGVRQNSLTLGQPGVERIEGTGGVAKFFDAETEQCIVVHKFEPMATSFFQPELMGKIMGDGYRGRVYWMQRLAYNFARKAGNGFFIAGYQDGNRTELANLRQAMEEQDGQPVIYVPLSQGRNPGEVLQHIQISLQGADFQWRIVEALNSMIRDAILGETNANSPAPSGIGGGQAEQRGMSDDERVKYDAKDLETPMQRLTNFLYRHNFPGMRPGKYKHLADKRNPEEFMAAVSFAMQAGMAVGENSVRSELGLPEPAPKDKILSLVQAQQATALQSTPAGTPISGQPGPAQQGGQQGPVEGAQSDDDTALENQIQPMATPQ
jgi:hypothetical protein